MGGALLREVRRLSLAEVDSERGTSRLVRDGTALDFTVEGLLLETQFEWLPLGWGYRRWLAKHCLTVNKLQP